LEYVFGDGADGKIAVDRYFLSTGQGRKELLFDAPPWHGYLGKQVVVDGTAASPQGVAVPVIRVLGISLLQGEPAAFATPVTGTRKIILLLVKYSGDSQEPHPRSWYADTVINPSTGNAVNSFYLANSWGNFGWSSDATNWMPLPHSKTYYASCGWNDACADLDALFNDAVTLGKANGVNFSLYDNIAIVTNNDLDCCAWGGSMVYEGRIYGTVWEPPWSAEQGVFSHELGHSIGLSHSGWVYYAYDSPWDVMSKGDGYNPVACGTYVSANDGGFTHQIYCYTPADIIAPYKDVMGWIDSAHLLTVPAGASATVVPVDTLAASLSSSRKMIKICVAGYDCTSGGATARYYTVEVRTHYTAVPGFDYYLQNEGVIIHFYWGDRPPQQPNACFFNSQSGPAYPIDNFNVVPAPHYVGPPTCSEYVSGQRRGLYYANWNDGQIYDNGAGIKVGVVSHSAAGSVTTYLVNINQAGAYTVTFYTDPTSGTITADGVTKTNGATGTYASGSRVHVIANPPSGYSFTNWEVSGVTVDNQLAQDTYMTVSDNGWLKAHFGTYSAEFVSDDIPTSMVAGQQYTVHVAVRNTGTNTWTASAGYRLGSPGDSDPFAFPRVELDSSASVGSGQTYTFIFTMTAPSSTGSYTTDWRMLREGVTWFGETLTKTVTVTPTTSYVLHVQSIPMTGVGITWTAGTGSQTGYTNFDIGPYTAGFTVTLTAPGTYGGYTFSHWTLDGSNMGSSLSLPVAVDDSHKERTAVAVYSAGSFGQTVTAVFSGSDTVGFMMTGTLVDDSAMGFIYAHRGAPKVLFTKTDTSRVQSSGQPTWSGYAHLVTVGGPGANPTVKYYEDQGLAPLRYAGTSTQVIIMYGSEVKLDVPLSSINQGNDYFVMEVVADGSHKVIMLWGVGGWGTYASGVYFDGKFTDMASLTDGWYIFRWQDLNGNGVPDYPAEFTIVASGS
jgi:M6 family metalloprotease-like protein